jgi:hypothetical protein
MSGAGPDPVGGQLLERGALLRLWAKDDPTPHNGRRELDERFVLALAITVLASFAAFPAVVVICWIWAAATGARRKLLELRDERAASGSQLLLGGGEKIIRTWASVGACWILFGPSADEESRFFLILAVAAATYIASKVLVVLAATRPDERAGSLVKPIEWLLLAVAPALWLLDWMWRSQYAVFFFLGCLVAGVLFLAFLIVRRSIRRIRSARREKGWREHHLYGAEPPKEAAEEPEDGRAWWGAGGTGP